MNERNTASAPVAINYGTPSYRPNLFRQAYFFQDSWKAKENLTVPETVAAAVCIILLMLLLSAGKTHRQRIAAWVSNLRWSLPPAPDRIPGD